MAPAAGHRVTVFVRENKTTDFYFRLWLSGVAAITRHGKLAAAAPNFDQPHDRSAWVHYSATAQSRDVRYAR
jgi:hypothetical protein